ncbi:hypothetical protein GDO81_027439 [Engystomops pustulosus]|uniref:Uncharacterized protein n=1 Tax=Engystomops pustulosus TaxID=76066 RepID=A0AAV6Z457_ENGPU|nr:hypothetical protein GDO81_027439 [Engystomops pustulosus]
MNNVYLVSLMDNRRKKVEKIVELLWVPNLCCNGINYAPMAVPLLHKQTLSSSPGGYCCWVSLCSKYLLSCVLSVSVTSRFCLAFSNGFHNICNIL